MKKSLLSILGSIFIILVSSIIYGNIYLSKFHENINIVQNHLENQVLWDLLEMYKDDYGSYPKKLSQLKSIYKDGKEPFGLNYKIILDYLTDPFTNDYYVYKVFSNKECGEFYILYSVGPDKTDDNINEIKEYERGATARVKFNGVYFDEEFLPLTAPFREGDISLMNPSYFDECVELNLDAFISTKPERKKMFN